jgi:ketosteroid isomerase-like protein
MKTIILFLFFTAISFAQTNSQIDTLLDDWHKAAAEAKFDLYFSMLTENAVFIGTDATENWNKSQFQKFAKPYFDKGKAWNFSALERHIFVSKDKKMAWFDELLTTQMKICRGSGVVIKEGKNWKIQHYVLSVTIPNENINEVVKIKSQIEDTLINKFKNLKNQ